MGRRINKMVVIFSFTSFIAGTVYGGIRTVRLISGEFKKMQKRQDFFEGLYRQINEWFTKEQAGKTLAMYLEKKQYKRIGIYGMGNLANRIYDALKSSHIKVVCCIDENKSFYSDAKLITMDDDFPEMDAVIITDFRNGEDIKKRIRKKGKFDICFLDNIIFNEL